MTTLIQAVETVRAFKHGSLRAEVAGLEEKWIGADKEKCSRLSEADGIDGALLTASLLLKREASQIDGVVHAVGILISLPYILKQDEFVEHLSLAAGNTGRPFDLETNQRIAEFKFIDWKGGPESIRQNQLFKDFYQMAEYDTPKDRYLYLLELERPLHFLQGGRALRSVLSKDVLLKDDLARRYGDRFKRVSEYFRYRQLQVRLVDLHSIAAEFASGILGDDTEG